MPNIIHHGRNIKRFREMPGIKQEGLAWRLCQDWNQKKISALEQKDLIEDNLLDQVAIKLKIPTEAIKILMKKMPSISSRIPLTMRHL